MRRMREQWFLYLLLALPLVALYFGVQSFLETSKKGSVVGKSGASPAHSGEGDSQASAGNESESPEGSVVSNETEYRDPLERDLRKETASPWVRAGSSKSHCAMLEYPGDGMQQSARISSKNWADFMKKYHQAKGDLLAWLSKNRSRFSEASFARMEALVKDIRVQRPPAWEEPDLAWRGIAVSTLDQEGRPLIRMGSGFLKMMFKDPKRGQFELTRVVAQSVSPCELKRAGGSPADWAPQLKCLGLELDEKEMCKAGSYSEAGWAISSAVAYQIAAPGCTLPGLEDPKKAGCMKTELVAHAEPTRNSVQHSDQKVSQ